MSFGLKNAGATYQRKATTLLHNMMHNEVEVYVDDIIVKSKDTGSHTINLRKLFERIKQYRLRLNPQKCTFGIAAGKLLGFLVSDRGIEFDPSKIKVILEMPPPKSEKEIKGFLGQLQYISRFIAKLTSTCEPIFKLQRKNEPLLVNPSSNSKGRMNHIHGMKSTKKPLNLSRNISSTHLS